MPSPLIPPTELTRDVVDACIAFYPQVLRKVYAATRPKLRLDELIEDDNWRYKQLPGEIAKTPTSALTKPQLARLVKWKIIHGVHRPFLPGMVQKNSDADVESHSGQSSTLIKQISPSDSIDSIVATTEKALKEVCKLKGVGPATGTLILSLFTPEIIPFFEDELFAWLVPEHGPKLKYDNKEYVTLLTRALPHILQNHQVKGWELEQTAYVLMHAEHLDKHQKDSLANISAQSGIARDSKADVDENTKPLEDEEQVPTRTTKRSNPPASATRERDSNPRRSKRRKA